jgi:DNA-binding transcriptional ArsR family regulator
MAGLERNFPSAGSEPTRAQMWAMAHPIRFRLLELLAEGPSTASRLARRLGESRGVASYHLRQLARTGAIVDDPDRGTRRERWWRRRERLLVIPTDADVEGRAISARMFGVVFARDEQARRRFIARDVEAAWHEGAFAGNWLVELTPEEAGELGLRLLDVANELRARPNPPQDATTALISISVLPWLD